MSNIRVLLVEDNLALAGSVGDYFSANQLEIDYAYNGLAGMALASSNEYDVMILDVSLPKIDGLTLCSKIRHQLFNNTPIIFLTARDTLEDKLLGFSHGADDYLVKPFALEELYCRVNVLSLRGPRRDIGKQSLAGLDIDYNLRTVTCNDITIKLHYLQMDILKVMVQHYPNTVSRESLEQQIWGGGTSPDSSPLRTHIYRLRMALEKPFKRNIIETVYGKGYQIVQSS